MPFWIGITQAQLSIEPCDGGGINWSIQRLLGRDGTYDKIGYDISTDLDINLDGKNDLLVSSPGRQEILVYFWHDTVLSDTAEYTYAGGGKMGVGDFNGDGLSDMIVHKPGVERHTKLDSFLVYYGRAAGPDGYLFANAPDLTLNLGWTDSSSGFYDHETIVVNDFNQDGYDDISISFPQWYENFPDGLHSGRFCLIEGGDSLTSERVHYIKTEQFKGSHNLKQSDCADVNGDSIPDFIYGIQRSYNSCLKIIYGKQGDLSNIIQSVVSDSLSFTSEAAYRYWAVLDVNADGIADLLFPGQPDTLTVYSGSKIGLSHDPYDIWVAPYATYHQFIKFDGRVENIGDYTGDGYNDYALICRGNWGEAIRVIYLGSPHGMTHMCETILTDIRDDGYSANQHGSLEDITGDGISELVISVPICAEQVGGPDFMPGWVYVFKGRRGKNLVSVERSQDELIDKATLEVTAHPNPSRDIVNIVIHSIPFARHQIFIVDVLGRLIARDDVVTEGLGNATAQFDLSLIDANHGAPEVLYALVKNDYTCGYIKIHMQ